MNQSDYPQEPVVDRPVLPEGYSGPEHLEVLLPWSFVEERMTAARNYWVCTTTRSSQPVATPVWGAWVGGKLYFDGSPETRRGRNIRSNPKVTVHLESGDQVVILEGDAEILTGAPERAVAEQVSQQYNAKYADSGYSPTPESWDGGGLVIFTPRKAMGWSKFPNDLTRWRF
jgi:PPOX class probable F420-dependent enzyme